jgi:hypothetical protein
MSGMYWGLTAMHLLGRLDEMDKDTIIAWIQRSQHESGGFGGSERNDAHMLYTLSAVQILALFDRLDLVDADKTAAYVAGLQQPDGSFAGDQWGEIDTRCGLAAGAAWGGPGRGLQAAPPPLPPCPHHQPAPPPVLHDHRGITHKQAWCPARPAPQVQLLRAAVLHNPGPHAPAGRAPGGRLHRGLQEL